MLFVVITIKIQYITPFYNSIFISIMKIHPFRFFFLATSGTMHVEYEIQRPTSINDFSTLYSVIGFFYEKSWTQKIDSDWRRTSFPWCRWILFTRILCSLEQEQYYAIIYILVMALKIVNKVKINPSYEYHVCIRDRDDFMVVIHYNVVIEIERR